MYTMEGGQNIDSLYPTDICWTQITSMDTQRMDLYTSYIMYYNSQRDYQILT